MPRYATLYKREGETPLMALRKLRTERGIEENVPMTYAGRLDPMAEGTLLILIGEECKKKKEYEALDKEYEFEILLGVRSDTGDILGLAEADEVPAMIDATAVKEVAGAVRGRLSLPYPIFSSKTVRGKPLFEYAREGRTHEIDIPRADMLIRVLESVSVRRISASELMTEIAQRIDSLQVDSESPYKDFRREDVLASWRRVLAGEREFHIVRMRAIVGSGTYIRSLAPYIADRLGACGLAYSIRRTKIGRYAPLLSVWLSKY